MPDTHAKPPRATLEALEDHAAFQRRHIGPDEVDVAQMLGVLGHGSLDALIEAVIPPAIRRATPMKLRSALNEAEALAEIRRLAVKNKVFRSFIGQGYYGTYTPGVILRNVLENPAWYTAYTPYQPEISQGRLEALVNFQTMVADLTGLAIANASMLDEATAAAEAMTLCLRSYNGASRTFAVADDVLPQTLDVVKTRAKPLGIEVRVMPAAQLATAGAFAILVQYPGTEGEVRDYRGIAATVKQGGGLVVAAADLLALTLLEAPGAWGADVAVGSAQRFGVPMGFGGPHAGFMAVRDELKRSMPGRLVGVTVDAQGHRAYRLALQTREQHIRREKATSNICTAQVLLAVMASMYAVYHGPQGLERIARRTHRMATLLKAGLVRLGFTVPTTHFFDTVTVATGEQTRAIVERAVAAGVNLRREGVLLGISCDETTTRADLQSLWAIFAGSAVDFDASTLDAGVKDAIPDGLARKTPYLTHPVFNRYHSETEMLRYLRKLADKDVALDRSMIPLGSCTMKLNATSEMAPVTWPEFGAIHPLAPADQWQGYRELVSSLERMLCEATGYDAVSLQPNAGSQGEYAGLLIIQAYHTSRGEGHRNVCLIPTSAHGTNPASAQMVGMQVVVVASDANGEVDVADLRKKAELHAKDLAAIMVTYPSTHGVFEPGIVEICEIVHRHGGQVYVDGANLNAMVGLAAPGHFGGDVSHLNLHKTFCIPHGGGGPGVGPVAVRSHLAKFLPGHRHLENGADAIGAVSAAPFGSASILPISWMYIAMMGGEGLADASRVAILNANYIARRLSPHYPVLYSGAGGLVAHECILDLRPIKESSGITVDDVAKRLIDYGFHAPTMSFPVAGTLMVEPTESESKAELDRFCEAMIAIRNEIRAVEEGKLDREDNPLRHAPHTAAVVVADDWPHKYSRELAAYPLKSLRDAKYWSPVGRADNVYGDRNLFCSCIPVAEYE
ncbi:glycine dehydrogenase (aminomethyl-transferring) [Betaproteobacteria bacterium GR16-43]|nr:glycine dehydrogenase (aminomethyl-transferring) [Betaproteobacteria bacterium GR16-43]